MKKIILQSSVLSTFILLAVLSAPAQPQNIPTIVEAEDGVLGPDFTVEQEGGVTYITTTTDGAGGSPENANRVATLEVTFPAAQAYGLYVRIRVGPAAANDDSFFYGNGFGEQSPASGDDWIRANNLYSVGYAGGGQVVGGEGIVTSGVWKWVNLSEFLLDEPPVVFNVPSGALTQTFQIGAREDGLDIDKVAFARADYFYTVSNLDNGQAGSSTPGGGVSSPPIADTARSIGPAVVSLTGQVLNNRDAPAQHRRIAEGALQNLWVRSNPRPISDVNEIEALLAAAQ